MKCISVSSLVCFVFYFLLAPLSRIEAQSQKDMDSLAVESERLLYINPEKSLLIDSYILKESALVSTKIKALLLQSRALLLKREYNSALSKLQQAHNFQIDDKDPENNTILLFYTGLLYQDLQLYQQAEELIGGIENSIKNSKKKNLNILLLLYRAQNNKDNKEEQLNFLYDAKQALKADSKIENPFLEKKNEYALAQYFFNHKQLDSATFHLKKLSNFATSPSQNDIYYFLAVNRLGEIALLQNNTEQAKELLEMNIDETKFGQRIFIDNYRLLSQIYYDGNNLEKFASYQKRYIETLEAQRSDLQEARVNAVNFYGAIKDNFLDTERENFQFKFLLFSILLVLFLALLLLYYLKTIRKNKSQLLVLENKKELEKAINMIEQRVAKENAATTYSIPEKTEQAILEKLIAFEKSLLFTDASLSMRSLASKLNTNTKYLSDIINNKKNKNFKTYINELRITYICELILQNPEYLNYKISYLAEASGFKSHSVFATVFKNITGMSPSSFLREAKKRPSSKV